MSKARIVSPVTPVEPVKGHFPRVISDGLLWTGRCLDSKYGDEDVHGPFSCYVVRGARKTMLIDTGHPMHWPMIEKDVERFLEGRTLDYIFPTHCELPHNGLLPQWMRKYPDSILVGNVLDYPLYYPHLVHRMREVKLGETIDLGGRAVMLVPAIWRDLVDTTWAFETTERVLFVSDAFAFLHHAEGQCDRMASERPLPDIPMIQFFNERALFWTRYKDPKSSFADIDEMLDVLRPRMIATAHGGIVDATEEMLPFTKEGMNVREQEMLGNRVLDERLLKTRAL